MKIKHQFIHKNIKDIWDDFPGYHCPFLDEIENELKKEGRFLEFFSIGPLNKKQKHEETLFFVNTLDEKSLLRAKRIINKESRKNKRYCFNSFNFQENEYSKKLELFLQKKDIKKLDPMLFFKLSQTSSFTLVDVNPSVYNCKCKIFNVMLSHGANLKHALSSKGKIKSYKLSFVHGVNILTKTNQQ